MNSCVNSYASRLRSEIEESLRNKSLFLDQLMNNHREYMEVLNLSKNDLQILRSKQKEKDYFLCTVVEGSEIKLSVEMVSISIIASRYDEQDCEKLIIAKCECPESNFFRPDSLENRSHLNAGMHKSLMEELRRDLQEKSIESAMHENQIALQASN